MTAAISELFHRVRSNYAANQSNNIHFHSSKRHIEENTYFVPSLEQLCINILAKNFVDIAEVDLLAEVEPLLYEHILARLLDVNESLLPLHVAISRISSELYWKRCCELSWSEGVLYERVEQEKELCRHIGQVFEWKRFYLENVLSDFIKSRGAIKEIISTIGNNAIKREDCCVLHIDRSVIDVSDKLTNKTEKVLLRTESRESINISTEDAEKVRELCMLVKEFIHTINLSGLNVHVALFYELMIYLPNVTRLVLNYATHTVGLSYSYVNTRFSDKDAECVRYVLEHCPKLRILELPNNDLTTPHILAISAGMLSNSTLQILNLSHNCIKDKAITKGISVVLKNPSCSIQWLILADNMIGGEGACALADALTVNKSLKHLDVSQNVISDENGGDVLVNTLVLNTSILELNMSNNQLGRSTVEALRLVLPQTLSLTTLNISGNNLIGKDDNISQILTDDTVNNSNVESGSNLLVEKSRVVLSTSHETTQTVELERNDNCDSNIEQKEGVSNVKDVQEVNNVTLQNTETLTNDAYQSIPHSSNGAALCEAVLQNDSLIKINVRNCSLTNEEVKLINNTVNDRVRNLKLMRKELLKEKAEKKTRREILKEVI